MGEGDRISKMVEFKDANEAERAVKLCNSGMMAVQSKDLFRWLTKVGNANAAGEYYLPDIVMIAKDEGRAPVAIEGEPFETAGVNSRAELAALERDWQTRRRWRPWSRVQLDRSRKASGFRPTPDGRDCTIEPHVVFGPGAKTADGATIRAFSHIEGASFRPACDVGPFARLRPGTVPAEGAKVGNFVEVKKATLGHGAKANHLHYIGDARVGEEGQHRRRHHHLQLRRVRQVSRPRSAPAPSSAATARWSRRSVSATAPVRRGRGGDQERRADELAIARGEQTKGFAGWAARFRAPAGQEGQEVGCAEIVGIVGREAVAHACSMA